MDFVIRLIEEFCFNLSHGGAYFVIVDIEIEFGEAGDVRMDRTDGFAY